LPRRGGREISRSGQTLCLRKEPAEGENLKRGDFDGIRGRGEKFWLDSRENHEGVKPIRWLKKERGNHSKEDGKQ